MTLPPTWSSCTIGELFEIGSGKTVNQHARAGTAKHPFLRTSNVLWGRVDLTNLDLMHFSPDELLNKTLRNGDLLVCEGGDIGRAAIWRGEIPNCGFQNHLHRLRPKEASTVPAFFMYALQAGFTLHGRYEGVGNKTTIPNLSRSRLEALTVPVPPPAEQARIAATLAMIQKAIQNEERATRAVRELRDALAEHLFTSGIRNGEQKESEVGMIPAHWSAASLGGHSLLAQYGLSLRGSDTGTTPILRMNCQQDGAVVFRDLQYVDLDEKTLATFRLVPGDLLFNRTNSIDLVGRTALFRADREVVFASYLVRLRVDEAVWMPDFINYYLNRPTVQMELKKLASRGVSQANISASKLKDFYAPLAPSEEQKVIVDRLATVDRSIAVHDARLSVLRDLFTSTLDKFLTGQLRAEQLDIDTSEVLSA